MWPQVVLLDQPFRQTLANSVRCMLAFLPHALAASIIQILFWGLVILCMPLGILLMIVFGFWFTCELCCQIVSGDLERVFHVEEQIRARKDAELAAALAAERLEDGADDGSGAEAASGVWPPQKGRPGMEQKNNLILQGNRDFFPAGRWTTSPWKTGAWCWTARPGGTCPTAATPPRSWPCRRSAT